MYPCPWDREPFDEYCHDGCGRGGENQHDSNRHVGCQMDDFPCMCCLSIYPGPWRHLFSALQLSKHMCVTFLLRVQTYTTTTSLLPKEQDALVSPPPSRITRGITLSGSLLLVYCITNQS